jgi:hypothetical protein
MLLVHLNAVFVQVPSFRIALDGISFWRLGAPNLLGEKDGLKLEASSKFSVVGILKFTVEKMALEVLILWKKHSLICLLTQIFIFRLNS